MEPLLHAPTETSEDYYDAVQAERIDPVVFGSTLPDRRGVVPAHGLVPGQQKRAGVKHRFAHARGIHDDPELIGQESGDLVTRVGYSRNLE